MDDFDRYLDELELNALENRREFWRGALQAAAIFWPALIGACALLSCAR